MGRNSKTETPRLRRRRPDESPTPDIFDLRKHHPEDGQQARRGARLPQSLSLLRGLYSDDEKGQADEEPSRGTGTVAPEMRQQPKEEPRRPAPPPTTGQGSPVQQPTVQAQSGVDPDVQALWARMTSKESSLKVFAELKDACKKVIGEGGDSSYYQVLGRFGVQHANEFKSTKPARECAAFIFSRLKEIQADQAGVPDAPPVPEETWEEPK